MKSKTIDERKFMKEYIRILINGEEKNRIPKDIKKNMRQIRPRILKSSQ